MRQERVNLNGLSAKTLDLGYVGEKNHTRVVIVCASMFEKHPAAVATMVAKPPVGDLYPIILTRDNNCLVWDVSESDLAYAGSGTYQLTFTEGEEVIKTEFGAYFVKASMESTGEPPEPLEDWLQEAQDTLADLESLKDISESASDSDIGKALSPKTVSNGKVTEWQYVSGGGGGGDVIDDTAGEGDTDKTWSADKLTDELALKATKASPTFTGTITGSETKTKLGKNLTDMGPNSTVVGIGNYNYGDVSAGGAFAEWTANTQYRYGDLVKISDPWSSYMGYWFCKTANSDASFTSSKWISITYDYRQHAFVVGNGADTSNITGSNALTVDWNGDVRAMGDVYTGASADGTGGSKLAKVSELQMITGALDTMATEEKLLRDELPGTSTTVTMDSNGNPTSIVHTANSETVRTDLFVWGTGTVTETRTLANGKYITITTNLETLAQTISEIQEVA